MVGLLDSVYWSSWFVTSLITYILPLLICSAIVVGSGDLWRNADYGIVFFFYLLYILSLIPVAFIVSIFFNKVESLVIQNFYGTNDRQKLEELWECLYYWF